VPRDGIGGWTNSRRGTPRGGRLSLRDGYTSCAPPSSTCKCETSETLLGGSRRGSCPSTEPAPERCWGLAALTGPERHDLLEVLEDRTERASTLITSQVPVKASHELIGEPTIADSICDRLVHTAYIIELQGPSLRACPSAIEASNCRSSIEPWRRATYNVRCTMSKASVCSRNTSVGTARERTASDPPWCRACQHGLLARRKRGDIHEGGEWAEQSRRRPVVSRRSGSRRLLPAEQPARETRQHQVDGADTDEARGRCANEALRLCAHTPHTERVARDGRVPRDLQILRGAPGGELAMPLAKAGRSEAHVYSSQPGRVARWRSARRRRARPRSGGSPRIPEGQTEEPLIRRWSRAVVVSLFTLLCAATLPAR